jgi:tetratricopeptide (TPR) repeat protein
MSRCAAIDNFCQGDLKGSLLQYQSILANNPNDMISRLEKAKCHQLLKQNVAAAKDYHLVQQGTEKGTAVHEMAVALEKASNDDKAGALEQLDHITKKFPQNPMTWNEYGEQLLYAQKFENAAAAFAKCVSIWPSGSNWTTTRMFYGQTLLMLGKYSQAKEQFQYALGSHKVALAELGLAKCFEFEGNQAKADEYMCAFEHMCPNMTDDQLYEQFNLVDVKGTINLSLAGLFVTKPSFKPLGMPNFRLKDDGDGLSLTTSQRQQGIVVTRKMGPSGKAMHHFRLCPSRKEAEDAARAAGTGPPIYHAAHGSGQRPHFHPVYFDKKTNKYEKLEDGSHYEYTD